MKHTLESHTNCRRDDHCPICDGGLANCIVCGAAEGELTTDCPEVQLDEYTKQAVFRAELDYKDGCWTA